MNASVLLFEESISCALVHCVVVPVFVKKKPGSALAFTQQFALQSTLLAMINVFVYSQASQACVFHVPRQTPFGSVGIDDSRCIHLRHPVAQCGVVHLNVHLLNALDSGGGSTSAWTSSAAILQKTTDGSQHHILAAGKCMSNVAACLTEGGLIVGGGGSKCNVHCNDPAPARIKHLGVECGPLMTLASLRRARSILIIVL